MRDRLTKSELQTETEIGGYEPYLFLDMKVLETQIVIDSETCYEIQHEIKGKGFCMMTQKPDIPSKYTDVFNEIIQCDEDRFDEGGHGITVQVQRPDYDYLISDPTSKDYYEGTLFIEMDKIIVIQLDVIKAGLEATNEYEYNRQSYNTNKFAHFRKLLSDRGFVHQTGLKTTVVDDEKK